MGDTLAARSCISHKLIESLILMYLDVVLEDIIFLVWSASVLADVAPCRKGNRV